MESNEKNLIHSLTKYDDLAGKLSKNFMEFFYNKHYPQETMELVLPQTKRIVQNNINTNQIIINNMDIYPNPADNFFLINYKLVDEIKGSFIVIYDLLGKIVIEIPVKDNNGIIKIDKAQLSGSSYYCCVLINNNSVISRKQVILTK